MDIGKGFSEAVSVAVAIIGLAIIAVLVSNRSQTGKVISAAGGAFSTIIGAAVAPVSGNAGRAFQMPTSDYIGQ